jgi:hypothetical protein
MKRFLLVYIIGSVIASGVTSGQGVSAGGTTRKFVGTEKGASFANPIVIYVSNEKSGVASEYNYLSVHFPGSKPINHTRQFATNRTYDIITFTAADGKRRLLYFDYRIHSER